MSVTIKVNGLDTFINKCKKINDIYPESVNAFMDYETKKLIAECKNASPYKTFKKRWFSKSKKENKADIWKGVFNKAPHLHLVLDGHKMWIHGKDTGKYVQGKNFLKSTKAQFDAEFQKDLEAFLNGVF